MAKRKLLPARRPHAASPVDNDSILLRSAESIGRLIGRLQRQLDDAREQLVATNSRAGERATDGKSRARASTAPRLGARNGDGHLATGNGSSGVDAPGPRKRRRAAKTKAKAIGMPAHTVKTARPKSRRRSNAS
jgi:hypothetical protein